MNASAFRPLLTTALLLASATAAVPGRARAQSTAAAPASPKAVFCGSLFDPHTRTLRRHVLVEITGERISRVAEAAQAPPGALDLGEGFDVKVLKEILKLRKQDKDERDEQESLLDLYMRAMETAGAPERQAA